MENVKHILESLLFIADEPLTLERLKKIVREAESREIRQALAELQEEYRQRQGGFDLRQIAGGYQFRSRNVYNEWITRLIEPSPVRLSKAALETLAIIAYKQPVIRSDVEHIRGVDCGGVLRVLLERQLIRVLGRKEIPGRPLIYATTKKFLEVFDLKDLKDLPSPKEIESFGQAINDGQVEVVESDEADAETSTAASGDSAHEHDATMIESGDSAAGSDKPADTEEAAFEKASTAEKQPAVAPANGDPDPHQPETPVGTDGKPDLDRSVL
jgi:segregation and condensation protein B